MADDPKISVFQLGAGGVQLVKSPLEMADTELVSAQNAEPYATRGRFGLRKRLGLTRVVPTGTVTPGSAGGAILGGFVIDDSLGYPPLTGLPFDATGADQVQFGFDTYSLDGGATWVAYTPAETFPAANKVYDIDGPGYNSTMTPLLPAVWLGGQYYFGGHISGQVLVAAVTKASLGAAPPKQLVIAEAVRVVGAGIVDDTVVLPNTYLGASFDPSLIISTVVPGGTIPQLYLYEPLSGTVKKLPQITTSSTVTGAAEMNGLLWVVAGLSLYSIDPQDDTVTTWTTAFTVTDSGIGSLAGLTQTRGFLCSGTITNTTAGPVRVYAFGANPDGTATASTILSVNQSAAPSVILGPYPALPTDTRISMLYKGTAPAFTTLTGSLGNAEVMAGTSTRILTYDDHNIAHNGVDTNTDDLVHTYFSNATPSLGPINSVAGRIQFFYSGFTSGVNKIGALQRRSSDNNPAWSASTPGGVVSTIINSTQTTYPQMIF